MKQYHFQQHLLPLAILFVCFLNSFSSLITAWELSPYDHLAWIAFIIWSVPILVYQCLSIKQKQSLPPPYHPILLGFVILLSSLSLIASLNVLMHFALALALVAFIPWFKEWVIWIIASISWMPFFGYLYALYFDRFFLFWRVVIAIFAALWTLFFLNKQIRDSSCKKNHKNFFGFFWPLPFF